MIYQKPKWTLELYESRLADQLEKLQEKEASLREKFPPDTCLQQRLNELLDPIISAARKTSEELQRIRGIINESKKTNAQRIAEEYERRKQELLSKLQGLQGNAGKAGKLGPDGIKPDAKKCK